MDSNYKIITCKAPVNMAVIKYWGKRDEDLILPINDSISCTLSMDNMYAKTTIMASPLFKESKFWLNKEEQNMLENKRLQNCLNELKKVSSASGNADVSKWHIHICSENNFPTAAGLASSAAGYACLIAALANLYDLKCDLTALARIGSGSACRSFHSGWVQWFKGCNDDGSDSVARQLFTHTHWPEIRVLILVINDSRKKYSSTSGMKQSVLTSDLLKYRASDVVPQRVKQIREAIKNRDFNEFAKITMKDSNQFHAICQDTFPPCVYLNDISHGVINLVHAYNEFKGENKVAYSFDAGPNACLFLLEPDVAEVLALINHSFPTSQNKTEYYRGMDIKEADFLDKNLEKLPVHEVNCLKYIICTKSGEGATVIADESESLLDFSGKPKFLL